jgi:hypothetical protein
VIFGIPVWAVWAADALVGRRALVPERVDDSGGRVIGASAPRRRHVAGRGQVEVAQIDGATALVLC